MPEKKVAWRSSTWRPVSLICDVGGQTLEAGAQRSTGGLELLGDVTEHGECLRLDLLRRKAGGA